MTRFKTLPIFCLALIACIGYLISLDVEVFYIAAPGLAATIVVLATFAWLWKRNGTVPLFNVGFICALATLAYTVIPLVNYWAGGMQFTSLSDFRLTVLQPDPFELGAFHWRHVLYLTSLCWVYIISGGDKAVRIGGVKSPSKPVTQGIVAVFFLLTAYLLLLRLLTGVNYFASYSEINDAFSAGTAFQLPLVVLQITGRILPMRFIMKLALLALVIHRCDNPNWRRALWIWLGLEVILSVTTLGARTETVLFLMAASVFYHRMVRPLNLRVVIPAGLTLLIGFQVYGFYRDPIIAAALAAGEAPAASAGNEFLGLLGTGYDVYVRHQSGTLHVPWQVYCNDIIGLLPPQQLLPFEKFSAAEWYLDVLEIRGSGVGFMWGIIAQSVVGLDWIELALRGAALGYVLALIHKWYLRHSSSFLATVAYVWLCLRMYNTFRDTTFSFIGSVLTELLPCLLMLYLVKRYSATRLARQPAVAVIPASLA